MHNHASPTQLSCREAFAHVWDMIKTPAQVEQQRILLRGLPGSGKSVLLAATAEMLRQAGWCVLPNMLSKLVDKHVVRSC